ncbi:hypothetical protein HDU98_004961 [Podochytrium sp. JEL0797]|nr:hypothetical protein HDU98_004961 [Podochytrium sp. JEL0797]
MSSQKSKSSLRRISIASTTPTDTPQDTAHQHPLSPRVTVLNPTPNLTLKLAHPPSYLEKRHPGATQLTQVPEKPQRISPSDILKDPSLLFKLKQRPLKTMSTTASQHGGDTAWETQSHTTAGGTDPTLATLDSYTAIAGLFKMYEGMETGDFPSNRRIRRFLAVCEGLISQWMSDLEPGQEVGEMEATGKPKELSEDGKKVVECLQKSLKRMDEFVTEKNQGELIQNMVANLRMAVAKDREFRTDEGEGQDKDEKEFDMATEQETGVFKATMELIKMFGSMTMNPSGSRNFIVVMQVLYDLFFAKEGETPPAETPEPTPQAEPAPQGGSSSSSSSSQGDVGEAANISPPQLPPKAAPTDTKKAAPSTSAAAATSATLTATQATSVLNTFLLPLLTRKKTKLSSVLTDVQAKRHAAPEAPAPAAAAPAAEGEWDATAEPAPALAHMAVVETAETSLVHILDALASTHDTDAVALQTQMCKMLECVKVLFAFGQTMLQDEDVSPGFGNIEILAALVVKFTHRFAPEPLVTQVSRSVQDLVKHVAQNLFAIHGNLITGTLDFLLHAFQHPGAFLQDIPALHKTVQELRGAVEAIESLPVNDADDANETLGGKVGDLWDGLNAIWVEVKKNDWVVAVQGDSKEWYQALFADEEGSMTLKQSLWKDFTQLVLPAILVDFKKIRIPELTYSDENVFVKFENMDIDVESMLPSVCQVKLANGIMFGFDDQLDTEYTTSCTVKFFQMHVAMKEVPFEFRKTTLFKLSEKGLMDVNIVDQGITIAINMDLDLTPSGPKTITGNTVNVSVEGVKLHVTSTKSDILYKVFEKAMATKLSDAIRKGLEEQLTKEVEKWDVPLTKMKKMYGGE